MPSPLSLRVPRLSRLEKVFLSLLALGVFASLAELLAGWAAPGGDLIRLVAYVAAFILLIKLLRAVIQKLLWRVRNRMILLYLFIGLVPLVLVTALVTLAGYVLTGQVAVYMASAELDRRAGRLQGAANALIWSLRASETSRHPAVVNTYLERAAESWPGLQAWVWDSGHAIVFPPGSTLEDPHAGLRDFRGIARLEDRFYLLAYVSGQSPSSGDIGRESVTSQPPRPDPAAAATERKPDALEVALLAPLTEAYLAGLAPGLGRISVLPLRRPPRPEAEKALPKAEPRVKVSTRKVVKRILTAPDQPPPGTAESSAPLPEPVNRFDYAVTWFTLPFRVGHWVEADGDFPASLQIQTRPSAVFRALFGQRVEVAQGVIIVFMVIGILFLIVEMLSLVIGISITRTLTKSVHELYEGTQQVNQGNFSVRIASGGNDQLAELARSFNSMTESIERLIEESKERQRLASELAIAREVQEQLFPKSLPAMRGLEILGVCNAARVVSGDYFDFVQLSEERLALAIGDVAGKGISGALLMASIQSMLRTQLSTVGARSASDSGNGAWVFPTALLVGQLNQQLYQTTSPEKFATFFFGAYDDRHGLLTYTNAGHLPPILIRDGEPRRLEVNGMIVGAFPFATYEQSKIELAPGDLMVAFTDGVTEPENEFAEEFGEDRLIELLVRNSRRSPREIIDEVIGAVGRWTGQPDLQDDMTLMVARRL